MMTRNTSRVVAALTAALVGGSALAAVPAQAAAPLKTKSLATFLTAQPPAFDSNGDDFDIVTAAVLAVLAAKPASPVAVLTQGRTAVTAFLPTDTAFANLVTELVGPAASESDTFAAVAGLGIDTVEAVLEYHVVPGVTIDSAAALASDGAVLGTALTGKDITVSVSGTTITLGDYDPNGPNPEVILSQVDLNAGNRQIAHGIDEVLLPSALYSGLGNSSLAAVLDAPADQAFDSNSGDFDIVTKAVYTVLEANPSSLVGKLADGTFRLTAFLPTDGAFQALVSRYANIAPVSEQATFDALVTALGAAGVENVLLYHVVAGGPINAVNALAADGTNLTTVQGQDIAVSVAGGVITLRDIDSIATNPQVIGSLTDINTGNKQLAHGINGVLLPLALLSELGDNSLASVLTASTPALDRFGGDYDIVTAAVLAVLAAKPGSPVAALSTGSVALTAFIPNDNAFIKLARTLTKKKVRTEAQAFRVIKRLGVSRLEQVLLYHVVVGGQIYSENALAANGASLGTALTGKSIGVRVRGTTITLVDLNSRTNPRVILSQVDINRGNLQVAHGIDRVLIPVKRLRLHSS